MSRQAVNAQISYLSPLDSLLLSGESSVFVLPYAMPVLDLQGSEHILLDSWFDDIVRYGGGVGLLYCLMDER
jgi:hypothetical protein